MKANRKFKEADERAVSAVIGVILMVAITVAIAATVYVYVSGMIGGTQKQTPSVSCTTDSSLNRIMVAASDNNVKWSDIVITNDSGVTLNWNIYTGGGVTATGVHVMPATTVFVTAGDYIALTGTFTGNAKITLRYTPTNSLIGSWTVAV
jgi:archaeal type IV pilus assembly protein PilA